METHYYGSILCISLWFSFCYICGRKKLWIIFYANFSHVSFFSSSFNRSWHIQALDWIRLLKFEKWMKKGKRRVVLVISDRLPITKQMTSDLFLCKPNALRKYYFFIWIYKLEVCGCHQGWYTWNRFHLRSLYLWIKLLEYLQPGLNS